jgi:probable rRNA maturation factor
MIDFDNQTSYEIYSNWFEQIEESLAKDKMLELLIVDDATIKELNLEHRKLDKPTDVLSFPIKGSKTNFVGSIIISADTANRVAQEMGHSLEEELKILFIHGLLHVLGFDHETDNGQMRQKETEIAESMGLSKSLLGR